MSDGRSNTRHSHAPVAALSDRRRPAESRWRISPPLALSAAAWHERGVTRESEGDLRAAIDCYRQDLRIGGADTQIVFDLAYALAGSGKTDAAIERYSQVIELDSRRPDAWLNLGDLLMHSGDVSAAVAALQRAVDLAPDDAAARYDLADVLDRSGVDDPRTHWAAFLRLSNGLNEHQTYAHQRLKEAVL